MKSRGMTLPELLVAGSVFFMAVLAIIIIERTSGMASAKEDAHTQTYRAVMLTMEHLRRELNGAMVTLVTPTSLEYRSPLFDSSGEPLVTLAGEHLWDPPDPDSFKIVMLTGGEVLATKPGRASRTLGHLGNAGKLTFLDLDPTRSDLVQITLLAKIEDLDQPKNRSQFKASFKVFLANQP